MLSWLMPDSIPAALTLSAVVLLLYAYAGYPMVLWLIGRLRRPLATNAGRPQQWPTVSVIISAHNEEAVIGRRIQNLLEQDYPNDRLQIVIGSDGSTDGTVPRASRYARFSGVDVAAFAQRRGKASVLNDLALRASGEYLVFTDAATVFYPDAIKELITGFHRYPGAAVIGGKLELRTSEASRNADGLYWRYEMFLKEAESRIGAGLGASGAIYAIRRRDYQPLPADTMADDLLEPMLVRLHTGGDVVLHADAKAWQVTPHRVADEFRRRVRTGGGITHALNCARSLLSPRWGTVAFALWSHKALRLLGPWILITAAAANAWALTNPPYHVLFVAQVIAYGAALAAGRLRVIPVVGKVASAARYFVVLNAAVAVGSLKFLFGLATPAWDRTLRQADHIPAETGWPELDLEEAPAEQRPAA